MYILIDDLPARCGRSSPTSGKRIRPGTTRTRGPATESDPGAAHDAALLVAALEAIESQRAALEWLLEADLLRLCLA